MLANEIQMDGKTSGKPKFHAPNMLLPHSTLSPSNGHKPPEIETNPSTVLRPSSRYSSVSSQTMRNVCELLRSLDLLLIIIYGLDARSRRASTPVRDVMSHIAACNAFDPKQEPPETVFAVADL